MDEDLKLARRLRNWRTISDFTEIDRLIAATDATITRLHGCRTADQDTIDGLVKERDEWKERALDRAWLVRIGWIAPSKPRLRETSFATNWSPQ